MNVVNKAAPFTLPPLPYSETALEPAISGRTMSFHYGKHHKAYVDKLNELSSGTDFADMDLETVIRKTHKAAAGSKEQKIFNNAAQIWNHTFFWSSMAPQKSTPSGKLASAIDRDLGGLEKFHKDFAQAGVDQFGSGWAWLTSDSSGNLKIEKTSNAMSPMAEGINCLLTVDVWEHAYYLDYQNRRPDFLKAVLENLLNWNFALQNYG